MCVNEERERDDLETFPLEGCAAEVQPLEKSAYTSELLLNSKAELQVGDRRTQDYYLGLRYARRLELGLGVSWTCRLAIEHNPNFFDSKIFQPYRQSLTGQVNRLL